MVRSFFWPASQARDLIEDPTIWLDGARPPPKVLVIFL